MSDTLQARLENTDETVFTGERFLPRLSGVIRYEHLHRYVWAREFVAGADVLDIACGEGYGAALMAERAASVVGVDIDAQTVEHASLTYAGQVRLRFMQGSCDAIPLPDASVDVAVSFETIEHLDRQEEMLSELRRVLRPGGLLVLSSPNRRVYSDVPGYHNPFHVKELYRDELEALLSRHFPHHRLYAQSARVGSFLYDVESGDSKAGKQTLDALPLFLETASGVGHRANDDEAVYFVALASDDPRRVYAPATSAYLNPADDTLAFHEKMLRDFSNERDRLEGHVTALQNELIAKENRLAEETTRLSEETTRLAAAYSRMGDLEIQLAQSRDAFTQVSERLNRLESHVLVRSARKARQLLGGGKGE